MFLSALVPSKEEKGRILWGFPVWPVKGAGAWRSGNVALGICVPESALPYRLPEKWLNLAGLCLNPTAHSSYFILSPNVRNSPHFCQNFGGPRGPGMTPPPKWGVEIWSTGQ